MRERQSHRDHLVARAFERHLDPAPVAILEHPEHMHAPVDVADVQLPAVELLEKTLRPDGLVSAPGPAGAFGGSHFKPILRKIGATNDRRILAILRGPLSEIPGWADSCHKELCVFPE